MQQRPIYDFLILKLDGSTIYVVALTYFMFRDKATMTYSTVCGIATVVIIILYSNCLISHCGIIKYNIVISYLLY